MSIYRYNFGGNTETSIEEQVEQMKEKILSALEGGASDKEIMMMVQESGLQDKYEFNWDSVEMKVEAHPIEGGRSEKGGGIESLLSKLRGARSAGEDRFGPKDPPGQRGDMFDEGGRTTFSYGEDDPQGEPTPPSWIANDPNFSNVSFLGPNYEAKLNRASGFGGEDFRFDLKGVKFYGMDDDGLTFVDENGNGWSAERDYQTGNPDDEGGGWDDMFNYLRGMGAQYSEEYQQIVKAADEKKASEPKGPVGTIIHKNGIITGSGDLGGEIIDLRPGRENLSRRQLRRGLKELLGE